MKKNSFRKSSKLQLFAFLGIALLLIALGSTHAVQADEGNPPIPPDEWGPFTTTGPTPPENVGESLIVAQSEAVLLDVPSYIWRHGCVPTSAGMLLGYWDGQGFGDLISGDASTQTAAVDQVIASTEHYNDYSLPLDDFDNIIADKSETGGAHANNSLADYILTSWSLYGLPYGWSFFDTVPYALNSYVDSVSSYYSNATEEYGMPAWADYKAEIDAGRPVLLGVDTTGAGQSDHMVIGIGYSDERSGHVGTPMYASYDTWYHTVRWQEYAPMAAGQPWGIADAVYFNLFSNAERLSNDDLATPLNISAVPYQKSQDILYATQGSEDKPVPNCYDDNPSEYLLGSSTLWYEYTPGANKTVNLDTLGSDYDTYIAIWQGDKSNLQPVACNDDVVLYQERQSSLSFDAVAGETYYFEVGEYWGYTYSGSGSLEGAKEGSEIVSESAHTLQFQTASFTDVNSAYWAWNYIEGLYDAGITGGCGSGNYCPGTTVDRAQMAVFLLKAEHGNTYSPPAATGTFGDVPTDYWAAAWIEQLAAEGITGGCGNGNYCPDSPVSRDQMAVFLLKAKYGNTYSPPGATGTFGDVSTDYWSAAWIEQLATEGITGGCDATNYCPSSSVNRDQMAVFLVKTFELSTLP